LEPWIADEDKETIVMHHGSVVDSRVFNAMVPTLARKYRVVRFDERGMGKSAMAPGTYKPTTERFVEDVLNIADALGLKKFHLYCQGSGGMIGMPFAIAHADRLKSLTMCQTPYQLPRELIDRYRLGEPTIGEAIKKYGFEDWNKRVPGYRVFELSKVDPRLPDWLREYRGSNPVEVAAGRYDWTFSVNLTDKIKDIGVPCLLINSEGSYQTPTKMGAFVREQNPNIKVVTLEGGLGQALAMLIPDRLATTLLSFLETIN
jgi:3-oxoadipate enol-lactonase